VIGPATVLRGVMSLRPLVMSLRRVDRAAQEGGAVAVLPGDLEAAERLRALMGVPASDLDPRFGLLVHAAVPDADHDGPARALALRKRGGGKALAVLVGRPAEREAMRRRFLAAEPLEESDLVPVTSLEGPGGRAALAAVARALGDEAVAAGRLAPGLRPAIAEQLIQRAARRSSVVGALVFLPGAETPVITTIQVALMAELAALYDHPVGPERAPEVALIFGAGFGWRALARQALDFVPGPGWALRGGFSYAVTLAVGRAARAWFEEGGDLPERPASVVRGLIERGGR
jgi:uncharacterized protein (DUF697 family)